jgi:effector-binding domain-containing protein
MRLQSVRLSVAALLAWSLLLPGLAAFAQTSPTTPAAPSTPAPATSTPVTPTPATPAPAPAAPSSPSQTPAITANPTAPNNAAPAAKPPAEDSGASQAPGISGDATMQTLEVSPRPVAILRGSATWEDGFKTLRSAIDAINAEIAKDGLQAAGRPIANFVQVNDSNFKFEVMVPIVTKPEGKTELSSNVKLGMSPGGKALKFQHRGAYDDIESTYDLITAFLDEKGLKAQDFFIEEYLTDLKDSEDQNLQVDIYIFLQ